jgi:hypothetical protein
VCVLSIAFIVINFAFIRNNYMSFLWACSVLESILAILETLIGFYGVMLCSGILHVNKPPCWRAVILVVEAGLVPIIEIILKDFKELLGCLLRPVDLLHLLPNVLY